VTTFKKKFSEVNCLFRAGSLIQRPNFFQMPGKDNSILRALEKGELSITGEFLWGSNYTFAVEISHDTQILQGVYKPTQGERPLWDFPQESLARREVAAYLVSEAFGWGFVPPTVYRGDGPIGPGSLQLYVDHDPEYNYFTFNEEDLQRLRPVALFDLLINNADRKGSHVLFDQDRHMWLIDHGISFHRDRKLRTVIWNFAGEPITEELCSDLVNFEAQLQPGTAFRKQLDLQLAPEEIDALAMRTRDLLATRQFPNPHPNRRPYPWPPV
jgi:uncharacterized repeat protein (TIGR03843 family)